jgi:hypothetical protein
MKSRNRIWLLIAGLFVAALGATLALTGALPKTDKAQGTQSDPHVGTSKHPAPKKADRKPAPASVAAVSDPADITALDTVNDPCSWIEPGDYPPSLQDNGKGAQKFSDMPAKPSVATYKCAVARAKAAGYYVTGNSVACDESVIELLDENNKLWDFSPFCMSVSQTDDPTCKVALVVTDHQGNFIWQDMPDLSWHQDILGDEIRLRDSYATCA